MKKFDEPVIHVEKLNVEDVITASNDTTPTGCGYDNPDCQFESEEISL